jgi:hypothetical protein
MMARLLEAIDFGNAVTVHPQPTQFCNRALTNFGLKNPEPAQFRLELSENFEMCKCLHQY